MDEIQTLLGYAERFLDRVRSSITLDEFRLYLKNLKEDASTLTDTAASARISAAVASARNCDYVLQKNPEMKNSVVLPQVEKLVKVIRDELRPPA